MNKTCCAFCKMLDRQGGLGDLYTAQMPKRKKASYHIDCVKWSNGILRRKYPDKADYVTHLYEYSYKKNCSLCSLDGPTVKYGDSGNKKIKEYYHYKCAKRVYGKITDDHKVDWIDFEEDQANDTEKTTGIADSQNMIEEVDNNDNDDIQGRKRKNEDITSASSPAFSDGEDKYDKEDLSEKVEYKRVRTNNYETQMEEENSYVCGDNISFENDYVQQQQMNNSFSSPFGRNNRNCMTELPITPTLFHENRYENIYNQQPQQPQQYPPPPPPPPPPNHSPSIPPPYSQQILSPSTLTSPFQPLVTDQQQRNNLQQIQQSQSQSLSNRASPTNQLTQALKKEFQFQIREQPSPIVPSSLIQQKQQQQQTKIQEKYKSNLSMTPITSFNIDYRSPISFYEYSTSKPMIYSRNNTCRNNGSNNNSVQPVNINPDILRNSVANVQSIDPYTSNNNNSNNNINNNNPNNNPNTATTSTTPTTTTSTGTYCDIPLETDRTSESKYTSLYNSSNNNSNSSNNSGCSMTYQLPPDNSSSSSSSSNSNNSILSNNSFPHREHNICNSSNSKIDYKYIFKHKNDGEVIKYNIFLEERDLLEVKIKQKNNFLCDGLFVCLYGPSNYMDSLRSNRPMEIQIDKALNETDFSNVFDNALASQICLIRLMVNEYDNKSSLKAFLNKLSKHHLIGYVDFNEFELFMIPNGMNIINCARFNFIVDRYMRNGPVIPAWVLLVTKANNNNNNTDNSINNDNNNVNI